MTSGAQTREARGADGAVPLAVPRLAPLVLRQVRVARGLTQQRLARLIVERAAREGELLSLSASAVSRWESGHFDPALRYRRHLAAVLGVGQAALFPHRSELTDAAAPPVPSADAPNARFPIPQEKP